MSSFSKQQLLDAQKSIQSTLAKCEKVLPKLDSHKSQQTLTIRRIEAFKLSLALIEKELKTEENV